MKVVGTMSTNLGFGGHNATILFKKYEEKRNEEEN